MPSCAVVQTPDSSTLLPLASCATTDALTHPTDAVKSTLSEAASATRTLSVANEAANGPLTLLAMAPAACARPLTRAAPNAQPTPSSCSTLPKASRHFTWGPKYVSTVCALPKDRRSLPVNARSEEHTSELQSPC